MENQLSFQNTTINPGNFSSSMLFTTQNIGGPFFLDKSFDVDLSKNPNTIITIKIYSLENNLNVTDIFKGPSIYKGGGREPNEILPFNFDVTAEITFSVPENEPSLYIKMIKIKGIKGLVKELNSEEASIPTSSLGLSYQSPNKNTDQILRAVQNVIGAVQHIGCKNIIPRIIYEIKNMPEEKNFETDPVVVQKKGTEMIDKIISEVIINTNDKESAKELEKSMYMVFKLCVENSTINGKIEQSVLKKNMIDIYSSFCPSGMLGTYTPTQISNVNKFGSIGRALLIFLFILLVVGLYYFFIIKKQKNKIPAIPRRIAAAFGRQIKAIRKM